MHEAGAKAPVAEAETKRGTSDVVNAFNGNCLTCHAKAMPAFDMVCGTRTTRELIWEQANMGWFLRVGNWTVAKLIQVLYDGSHRAITYRWLGHTVGDLVSGYQLGTPVDLRIVASGGSYSIYANGALKATQSRPGTGLYFKAGDYPQSNPGRATARTSSAR